MQNALSMHHQRISNGKQTLMTASNANNTKHGIKSTNKKSITTSGGGHVNGSNGAGVGGGGPLDSLPKAFVTSMKTLFDILDDQHTGYVKLEDIEKGWQDDGSKGLPHGVIDSLRKVTPSNGMLTFERFCAGLKICLLRNQTSNNNSHTGIIASESMKSRRLSSDNLLSNKEYSNKPIPIRPPSAPLLDIENPMPNSQWNNTATVRPMPGQRALSLPQLSPGDSDDLEMLPQLESNNPLMDMHPQQINQDIYGSAPPKPPRSAILTGQNSSILNNSLKGSGSAVLNLTSNQGNQSGNGIDKAEIRSVLQNWQMGILMNEMDAKEKRTSNFPTINRYSRGMADGGSTESNTFNSNGLVKIGPQSLPVIQSQSTILYPKKTNKRREPRRHTLQNGIDYNLLKRLKQFEEERDLLYQGYSAIEKAREWYLQQIATVQEKIKYLGRMGTHVEQWSEVHQERLDFQRARVLEINRHLSTLADTWERGGFPSHMNLAVRSSHNVRGHIIRPIEKD